MKLTKKLGIHFEFVFIGVKYKVGFIILQTKYHINNSYVKCARAGKI